MTDHTDTARYVVWSNQHAMWWRANRRGYTPWLEEAGRYTRTEAEAIVTDATLDGKLTHRVPRIDGGEMSVVDEHLMLAPESLTDLLASMDRFWAAVEHKGGAR